jgi:hypothetical protein
MKSPIRQTLLALLSFAVGLAGCARYEWIPDTETDACRNRSVEPSASVPRPHFIPAPTHIGDSLSGVVVIPRRKRPVYSAVTVYAGSRLTTMTDSAGRFSIWAPPGRYRLQVQTIGYKAVSDSLTFPPPTDSLLSVTVETEQLVFDGPCSGFMQVRVHKPWWKLW